MNRAIILAPDINGKIIGIVPLTRNQQALIDLEDIPKIVKNQWTALKRKTKHREEYDAVKNKHISFVKGKQKQRMVYMSRLIMDAPSDLQVDHLNGNSLDNRRSNLRLVTIRENAQNRQHEKTSKYPGVYKQHDTKWGTKISINGKREHLGVFDTELEAFNEYNRALKEFEETGKITRVHVPEPTSKYKGVSWDKKCGKWHSRICIRGKQKNLGFFDSELNAAEEYMRACNEFEKTGSVTQILVKKQTSEHRGVCWNKLYEKWQARITINGKRKHLGYFKSEQEAAEAYKKANDLEEV